MDKKIQQIIANHKEIQKKISILFQRKELKDFFILEAMTGLNKFGIDSQSTANYIMTYDENTNKINLHNIFENCSENNGLLSLSVKEYVYKVSKATNFSVAFKASKDSAWSSIRAIVQNSKMNEAIELFSEEQKELNEFDFNSSFGWLKGSIKKVISKFSKFINNLMSTLRGFMKENIFKLFEPKINLDIKIPL
jgi:hypothetical protein